MLAYTFNEQSLTPYDYSGNKITAASNNVSFVVGQNYGYAAHLPGTPGTNSCVYVTLPIVSTNTFTVFSSFNLLSLPGSLGVIINTADFSISVTSSGAIRFYLNSVIVTSATTITTGWNTVACIYDGTTGYIYVNGVLDANMLTGAGAGMINGGMAIGAQSLSDTSLLLNANVDCLEIRNTALQSGEIAALHNSPGGTLVSGTPHNFAMGDLIADPTITNTGVVTWVADVDDFYFYPTSAIGTQYLKIGNILNPLRQNYMEMNPDFDGNGNGQTSIKYSVAGFSDYESTSLSTTFDHRGLISKGRTTPYTWFSETQARNSQGSALTTVSQNPLFAGDLQSDGAYFYFSYLLTQANNNNTKSARIVIDGNIIAGAGFRRNETDYYWIEGTLKMLNLRTGSASCKYKIYNTSSSSVFIGYETFTINFEKQNWLLLQLQGAATNDITYLEGEGHIHSIPQF